MTSTESRIRFHRRLSFVLSAIILPAAWVQANAEDGISEKRQRLEHAIEQHDRGVEGSETALGTSIAALSEILEKDPENAVAKAYLGSAYTLKARDAALWNKRQWVERGIATIDAAVALNPDEPKVRFVRAVNGYNLPRMAGRYDIAAVDFKFLLETIKTRPELVEADFQQAIFFHAGTFALKQSEYERAVALLEKALETGRDEDLLRHAENTLRIARTRIETP